ncbi:MAG: Coenzyme F420 hydrogenase/dehydrogenase, beta subunit C-terminal domain [Ruminococcus sp.]|nr:Coenzyme F420 hydrogenase/dehydrogenase, beta subunit C-terminal domain [Ruminococcus sp.]
MNNILAIGKSCCGCMACAQVCPKNCIKFVPDKEGFLYPQVDSSLCIDCGLCSKRCPVMSEPQRNKNPKVYAAKINDTNLSYKSSSGGIFPLIAKNILSKGGSVFGCAYDENMVARHIEITDESQLYRLQNSKYVQSDMEGVYTKVKAALDSGKYVLFSGTGCQIGGLHTFLNKKYDRLFTVDIVCHGVPSPALFEKYIDWKGKQMGGKLTEYSFRSKEKCGWNIYYKATNDKRSKSQDGIFDPYYNAFLKCRIFRESCYECKYANSERASDITLGDFWGIEISNPEFYDLNGVSVVLVNTDAGKKMWEDLSDSIKCIPSTLETAAKMNENLVRATPRPDCRDTIYDGFDVDTENYFSVKLKPPFQLKKRIKMLVPISVKGKIKHMLGK